MESGCHKTAQLSDFVLSRLLNIGCAPARTTSQTRHQLQDLQVNLLTTTYQGQDAIQKELRGRQGVDYAPGELRS